MIVTTSLPSDATLKKYGLVWQEWLWILERQGYLCPICGKEPSINKQGKKRWVVDHVHVQGWKKMRPEKRKTYVRGITCWFCNRNYLAKGISVEKAQNLVKYLQDYQSRSTK